MLKGREARGEEGSAKIGESVVESCHVRVFNVVFQTIEVLVAFAAVADGALIRLRGDVLAVVCDEITVTVLVVVL